MDVIYYAMCGGLAGYTWTVYIMLNKRINALEEHSIETKIEFKYLAEKFSDLKEAMKELNDSIKKLNEKIK